MQTVPLEAIVALLVEASSDCYLVQCEYAVFFCYVKGKTQFCLHSSVQVPFCES